jgi:hypothetical protein
MNSVKVKWTGKGSAPATLQGGGFSLKPYEVKSGQAEIDERDLYTVINRKAGEWEQVANVSSTRTTAKDEPGNSGGGNQS